MDSAHFSLARETGRATFSCPDWDTCQLLDTRFWHGVGCRDLCNWIVRQLGTGPPSMHGGKAHRRRSCWLAPSPQGKGAPPLPLHRLRGGTLSVAQPPEPSRAIQAPSEFRALQSPPEPARGLCRSRQRLRGSERACVTHARPPENESSPGSAGKTRAHLKSTQRSYLPSFGTNFPKRPSGGRNFCDLDLKFRPKRTGSWGVFRQTDEDIFGISATFGRRTRGFQRLLHGRNLRGIW